MNTFHNPKEVLSPSALDDYRLYRNASQPTQLYLNNDTGDNANDGLTPSTAKADIYGVILAIQEIFGPQVEVEVANTGTPYQVDGIQGLNSTRFTGEEIEVEERNITSVTSTGNNVGCIFTVDGATLANNEWAGKTLRLKGVAGNLYNINVDANVGNTIYGCTVNRVLSDIQVDPTGGTVALLSLPEFNITNGTVFSGGTNVRFNRLNITGGQLFVNEGGKFEWFHCQIQNTSINAGLGAGTVFIFSSAIAMTGTSNGILLGRRGGVLQIGTGNVFSPVNLTDPTYGVVDVAQDSTLVFSNGQVLNSHYVRMDGANSSTSGGGNLKTVPRSVSGSPTVDTPYVINSRGNGLGYGYFLPNTQGAISGDYLVEAERGANVEITSGTSVTTALGTNTVSADGGNNESAYSHLDGTFINFGSVSPVINRNYLDDGIASDTVYANKGTGDDVDNNGSSGSPFAGIGRALMEMSLTKKGARKIILEDASQTYDLDFHLINTVGITIEGVPEVNETRNVTGTPTVNRTTGVSFTVDGTTLANDAWKGRILYLNDVLSDQRQILVHGNIGNTIYGRMTSRTGFDSSQNSWTGGTVDLMDFPTINITGGNTNIIGNLDFTLSKVKLTGDNIYVEAGRLTVQWSEIDDITQIGGEIFLISSVYNPAGSATFPAIQAYAGARVRFYTGSVLTDKNCPVASTDSYFISTIFGASMVESGGVDFVGLGENGIEINSADFGEAGWFIASQAPIYFVDYNGATCKAGFKINTDRPLTDFDSYRAAGGRIYIGECVGSIDGDYFVTAQRAADVFIDSSSSVTTDLGTNTVSADGGATLSCSASDGTRITGGSPDLVQSFQTGALKTIFTAVGNVGTGEDDLMTYDLPANTLFANGDTIEIVTGGVAQSTQTFKLYFGSTAILTHTFTGGSPKDFKVTATIMKDATGSQKAIANLIDGGGTNVKTEYTDVAEDETTTLTIKGTGQGTSNDDIVQELMTIKYVQAA